MLGILLVLSCVNVHCEIFVNIFSFTATLFTLKKSEGQEEMEEDEFQTDDDDMEVSETEEEKQAAQKRKKVF